MPQVMRFHLPFEAKSGRNTIRHFDVSLDNENCVPLPMVRVDIDQSWHLQDDAIERINAAAEATVLKMFIGNIIGVEMVTVNPAEKEF